MLFEEKIFLLMIRRNGFFILCFRSEWFEFTVTYVNVVSAEGPVKLSFESSLKLKDVESDNKDVTEGEYEPSDCTARQSVAILIPHRNRERHLLYLLHHLHPFLQRQQLHYAIYVIQQVFFNTVHSFPWKLRAYAFETNNVGLICIKLLKLHEYKEKIGLQIVFVSGLKMKATIMFRDVLKTP